MIEAFPLSWPANWPRARYRTNSRFQNTTFAVERDLLMREVRLLGGQKVILSTNIPLRNDGLPYANRTKIQDPGVAVYFTYKQKSMVFACDRWDRIEDNMRAVLKTIEAIRGIERWGASDMMERAFTGFMALAAPKTAWWEILGIPQGSGPEAIKNAYRALSMIHHPDRGGDPAMMAKINEAYREASK